ncbi:MULTISPECIES: HAMP domain-containing sensor histidine kinase [unclassified Microbacterium]|uniref:sensor histidine kinase n=1 Tax=unclassified Microbacterium TaxID=2609290 RepID=UPI00214B79E9|nr:MULTISPECIES: HAMP domain-containing sensor histidine kinase [unclassified Microbacterium]MCR2783905.1 HAMP domain-containing histidine kinase [Microbacterium sp. zg.B96]WIM15250.1 HAMP domain-containing sensor histidine kinase [Microbacterium sp. zg-B96]
MSEQTDAAIAADQRRVERAALRAGLWVALASAAVVGLITAVTVTVMIVASRPERRPPRDGDGAFGDLGDGGPRARVIDLDDVVPLAIALGILGVIALGVIAWYASKRAAQPLAEALRVQRAFVADASHELRTPLTTLTSRIQLAQHRAERGGDVDAVLADLRRDAAVMDAALTDLLVSAESAGARAGDESAVAPVAAAAADAAAVIEPRAAERGVAIVVDAPAELEVGADRAALTRALIALIDNAVRYSPAGSAVRVQARPAGRHVAIRVIDQGTGIAGIAPDRLFERFARSTEPSGRSGFGLGLALVRDIATRFGGSIELESTSPQGTAFLLTLPARGRHGAARAD